MFGNLQSSGRELLNLIVGLCSERRRSALEMISATRGALSLGEALPLTHQQGKGVIKGIPLNALEVQVWIGVDFLCFTVMVVGVYIVICDMWVTTGYSKNNYGTI